jgi:hypothetical protein
VVWDVDVQKSRDRVDLIVQDVHKCERLAADDDKNFLKAKTKTALFAQIVSFSRRV